MEKQNLKFNRAEDFEYEVCSYLLRNRILNAYIHANDDFILDRLGEYMSLCHIPYKYIEDDISLKSGYILCELSTDGEEALPHINIVTPADDLGEARNNGQNIVIDGELMIEENDESIDLDNVPVHLQNSQIRKMFLYAFKIADSEIDIISPWMNAGVINNDFLALMDNALSRGVKIKIIYGLKPNSSEYNLSRSSRSDKMADLMRSRFADKGDLLTIRRDNIHYKLVLCDEKYKLEGGFNYLSFIGNYDNPDTRKEGSPFGRDVEEIRYLRKQYFEE